MSLTRNYNASAVNLMKDEIYNMKKRGIQAIYGNIKANKAPYGFILPYLILFFTFTVLPVIISVILSFTSFNVLEAPKLIGFDNYFRLLFKDRVFLIAVKNTMLIALITGPVGYMLCMILAWFINELSPMWRTIVTLIFYAPSISGNAYLIWSVLFSSDSQGYINSILIKLGFITTPVLWLQNSNYMLKIVILVSVWMSFGTGFLTFIAGFQGIDKSYYEASALDGIKNRWQELWFITLPMIRPQMMFSAVMSITSAFGVGTVVTNLCGFPSSGYAAHTIMNHLQDYGSVRFEMGYASTIATLLFFVSVLCNLIIKKLIGKVGE